MKRCNYIIFALCVLTLSGCYHFLYKIQIEKTDELKITIKETEALIKKVDILYIYKGLDYKYPLFFFKDNGITMMHTIVNYNPNDSIREGRRNPNLQNHIDTCKVIPGLTVEEWDLLKSNLRKLEKFGIKGNNVAFYNDAKFQFFYYDYIYPKKIEYMTIGYLALLSDEIINTKDFKLRFVVMDKKDGIYLIKHAG